ncbi:SurA-like protein [Frankia sp. AgKG'84/4]
MTEAGTEVCSATPDGIACGGVKLSRLLAGVGMLVVVLAAGTACTTHAGAAAQVGSYTIETSQLRDIVSRGLATSAAAPASQTSQAAPGALEPPAVQQRTLSSLVQLQLLSDEARRRGITVSDGDVAAYTQAFAVLQYGSLHAFQQQLSAAAVAPADVDVIMRAGALESAISDQVSPKLLATEAETRQAYNQSQRMFGRLPLTYPQAKPYLARLIVATERGDALRPVFAQAEKANPVSVNPRFGRWDSGQFSVVAADGTIASTPGPTPAVDLSVQS